MEKHDRLKLAREAAGIRSARSAAERVGVPYPTYAHHESGTRGIKDAELIRYASAFKTTVGWLLTGEGDPPKSAPVEARAMRPQSEISAPQPAPEFSRKRLPVIGLAVGGDDGRFMFNGEIIDDVPCPPGLENVHGAYALWVSGESMAPRFRPGETVWVHPTRPPRRGDDVVIQLYPDHEGDPPEGYIKEFVHWTPTVLVAKQHNPSIEIEYDKQTVKSVHVIVGSLKI